MAPSAEHGLVWSNFSCICPEPVLASTVRYFDFAIEWRKKRPFFPPYRRRNPGTPPQSLPMFYVFKSLHVSIVGHRCVLRGINFESFFDLFLCSHRRAEEVGAQAVNRHHVVVPVSRVRVGSSVPPRRRRGGTWGAGRRRMVALILGLIRLAECSPWFAWARLRGG